ncbi:class I adenylate-forming enzyme family protein [Selenomonas ruminantium]|uniref:class I adenylate-forming enzyme family protein n=1 Tax=Selenomonas ruminantium TaxID=971 RepID=UPI001567E691|nr:long-chain-fatty-acid--CoA ligase [Selenomonas ruminantium]
MFVHDLIMQGKPEAMAIVDHERRFTYKEAQEAVKNCRNRLYEAGVREGDRVGIFSRNSADFVFAYMGATSLGAIAVPINFQLSNREIAYIIKDSGIRVLLTYQPLNLVDALAALRCDLKVTQYDIKTMGKANKKIAEAPALRADFDEHKPCATIYTSGTTGNPKGAVLSHRNLVANCEQMRDNGMGCKPEHNVLCVLPMYHAFGWTCSVLYSFFCGAEVVILDSFTPKETIAVIREEKVTDLYIVPSICSLLTKLASTEDMKPLRLVVSGGTTLPLQIQQDFIKKFGVDICEGYGLSETSPVVTMNPPEKPIVGSCGKIVPGITWKLIDGEGKEVPQGEAGELIVKGENIMLGYWNLPDVTQDAMRGGWFHTGDVARADEEGYIYIVDRIKDMIISMGENIYPREVEELVYQFPGIFEAAVIGIEDKLRGQAGACFYSTHDGKDINVRELKKFLQANLALYKIPREFHLMEKLPRTSTGKIAKRMILDEFRKSKKK